MILTHTIKNERIIISVLWRGKRGTGLPCKQEALSGLLRNLTLSRSLESSRSHPPPLGAHAMPALWKLSPW